jgi:hypothetical protein
MDVVANISNAIEIAKKLRELSKKVEEADFRMLLADLTDQLGDAKLQATNLKIELAEALGKVHELERRATQVASAEPQVHDGAYVFGDTNRHYCTGCYDARGQKILLNDLEGVWSSFGKRQCPVCEKTFGSR